MGASVLWRAIGLSAGPCQHSGHAPICSLAGKHRTFSSRARSVQGSRRHRARKEPLLASVRDPLAARAYPPHRDRPRQSQKRRDVALLRSSPAPLPRARRRPPPRGDARHRRRGEGSGPTRGEHRGVGRVSTLRLRGSGRPARLLRGVHRFHRPRRKGRRTRPRALAASLPDPSRTPRNTAEPTLTGYDNSRPSSSGGAFLGRSARVQSITRSLLKGPLTTSNSLQKFSPKTFSTAKFYRRIDRARPAPASPFDSSCTSPSGSPAGGGTPTIA